MNNYIFKLLKIIPVSLSMLFLCMACENETTVLSPEDQEFVPVTVTMDMAPGTFDTSIGIEPMKTKNDQPGSYNVLRFGGYTTLFILKQVEGGWVIEKRIDDVVPLYYDLKNDTPIPFKVECELRSGVYRFVLFANQRTMVPGLNENLFVKDPSKTTAIKSGSMGIEGVEFLFGTEMFIAKTPNILIDRNTNLNEGENRIVSLELKRVVGMIRMAYAMDSELLGQERINFNIKSDQPLHTTVNLFGDLVRTSTIEKAYGVYDIVATNVYKIDNKNFYFASFHSVSNTMQYFLLPESNPEVNFELEITNINDGDYAISCPIKLRLNTINGIVIHKNGQSYHCYEKNGVPYPVDFSTIPNSNYIESNNDIR